jgi:hypothetical protein
MAILDDVPGLKVEVHVDGSALKEYDDDDGIPQPKRVTKYIEAVTGASLKIKHHFTKPFPTNHGVTVRVRLDGQIVRKPIYRAHSLLNDQEHTISHAR